MNVRRWMLGLWLVGTVCWIAAFVGFIPLYICKYEWTNCALITLVPPILLGLFLLGTAWVGTRLFRRK